MNNILISQVESLIECEDTLAALCNAVAALNEGVDRINWVGVYLYKDKHLSLGPFQGKPACTTIDIGKGVCGTSFQNKTLLNVPDVEKFKGHIACDSASKSELVVPLIYEDKALGVLDCDSPELNRFTIEEEKTFSEIASMIAKKIAG